jgi:hypothetical protein
MASQSWRTYYHKHGNQREQPVMFLDDRRAKREVVSANEGTRPFGPEILIHLHIPKTAGLSLSSMVRHGFPSNEVYETPKNVEFNGLGFVTLDCCVRDLVSLSPDNMKRIRYVCGSAPFGLHRAFERSAKYFTVIRHPVDRVISWFFYITQENVPYMREGRLLTFEEYVESRYDIQLNDYQVRVVSGCSDLDADLTGGGAPVKQHQLELAKRNIDELFLAAAPLEQMTELALMVRMTYGWPMRRLQSEYQNRTKRRPRIKDIPARLVKIIEDCNSHDMELYEWVRKRFAAQKELFEPRLSKDRRVFGIVNHTLTTAGKILPRSVRKHLAKKLFYD